MTKKLPNNNTPGAPLIDCKDLTKEYVMGETVTTALHGITCTITRGEFVSIMGPSGSGKSTLMHLLSLLERPTSGTYNFDGKDALAFDDATVARLRNQKIGFVFQSFNLLSRVSVYENVELPLLYDFYSDTRGGMAGMRSLVQRKRTTQNDRVMAVVDSVGMLHRINHMPHQLSGGEKQRVAIARALINDPEIIFADEPTGNLDSRAGTQVLKILQDLNEKGHTIILVTHERATAEHAKRILTIVDGVIRSDEPVAGRRFATAGELTK